MVGGTLRDTLVFTVCLENYLQSFSGLGVYSRTFLCR